MKFVKLILVTITASLSLNINAAPIVINSFINMGSSVDTYTIIREPVYNRTVIDSATSSDYSGQDNTINTLSSSVNASINGPDYNVSAYGTIDASWIDTAHGNVVIDVGLNVDSIYSGRANLFGTDGWEYTFTADSNGYFNLNYNSSHIGGAFGEVPYVFNFNGDKSLLAGGAGLVSEEIFSGQTYTVGIGWDNELRGAPNVGTAPGHGYHFSQHGEFSWEVSPVPVPAAIWLFGSGLIGLTGFARRKKA